MKGFATSVLLSNGEFEWDFHTSLESALLTKARYYHVEVHYAHTEKKGYNTIIVSDGIVCNSDGTPI